MMQRLREDLDVRLASPRGAIEPFRAMGVLAEARKLEAAGRSIIHLELGEPAVIQPASVQAAVVAAMQAGRMGYTQSLGAPSLRAAIARLYAERYGLRVHPDLIAVTTGSSAGFVLAFLACFPAGARVAIPNPGYPAYRNILKSLDLAPVAIETGPETRFVMTPERLEAAGPLDGVLMMSPANPTGVTMERAEVEAVAAFCARRRIPLISDEIYHGLTFGTEEVCAFDGRSDVIIVNSFSKFHAMTGWRVGWLVLPEARREAVEKLAMNLYLSPPAPGQAAAEAALAEHDFFEAVKEGYGAARDYLLDALPALGLAPWPADGAFYAYCDASRHSNDSEDFCRRALHEAGVAMTPGVDFDPVNGHRFVRLSFAAGETAAREGVARLKDWLGA